MKPMAFLNLFAGTLLLLTAASLPETTFANACGMQYKALPAKKKPNTKRMQKNIYNYGRTLVRFNGNELWWNEGSGWKFKQSHWTPFSFGITDANQVYELLEYGVELVAFTEKGIYYSKDGCQSWKFRISRWPSEVNVNNLQVFGSKIISISDKGVYSSDNGGEKWKFLRSKF